MLILPDALYTERMVLRGLFLAPGALMMARRAGAVRHIKYGHTILYKGSWILEWLESMTVPATAAGCEQQEQEPADV
jgi:hypothetical protein